MNHIYFKFNCEGFREDDFELIDFAGVENISQLFNYNVTLKSYNVELDTAAVTGKNAFITIYYGDQPAEKQVALLGFAFKGQPPTTDVRYSPTIDLAKILTEDKNLKLFGHDYLVPKEVIAKFGAAPDSLEECFQGKSCVVIMTNHPKYKDLDVLALVASMKKPALLFDPWSIFSAQAVNNAKGVYYANLGYNTFRFKKKN